jgi:hypothetical protein
MPVIARCNGTLLVEEGGELRIVAQGGGWLGTAVYVTGLLTLIAMVNGLIQLTRSVSVGMPLLAFTMLLAAATTALLRRKRAVASSSGAAAPWLTFDFEARVLRDQAGAVLGSLDQVRAGRVWQLASSSRALRLKTPAGSFVIARGTPFGDSVDEVEDALRARGIAE